VFSTHQAFPDAVLFTFRNVRRKTDANTTNQLQIESCAHRLPGGLRIDISSDCQCAGPAVEGLGAERSREGSRRIYLFKDERSLDNYFSGPIAAQINSHPALFDLSAKRFDVMKGVTAITHGPIPATVGA
jgi:hypothetical protein